MNARRIVFWICFLGGAAAFALAPEYFAPSGDAVVEPVVRRGSLAELGSAPVVDRTQHGAARPIEAIRDSHATQVARAARVAPPEVDLFAARTWQVAPAPVSAPVRTAPRPAGATAARQTAAVPPMPFRFIGKLDDGEQLQVFLLKDTELHVVEVGDVIDERYRVDSISGAQMTLVFLPLQAAQTLTIGSVP